MSRFRVWWHLDIKPLVAVSYSSISSGVKRFASPPVGQPFTCPVHLVLTGRSLIFLFLTRWKRYYFEQKLMTLLLGYPSCMYVLFFLRPPNLFCPASITFFFFFFQSGLDLLLWRRMCFILLLFSLRLPSLERLFESQGPPQLLHTKSSL